MKLKCQPADFQVEELTQFAASSGPFALYRLTKESLGTPEAIGMIADRWRLARPQISFGGLKDKHARTQQFVTVQRGPDRDLQLGRVRLQYLGQAERPFTPRDISANRFHLVLRDMAATEVDAAVQSLRSISRDGLLNYFDEQRFGSLGETGEFIALPWCRGDYERALWLAVADFNADDSAAGRAEKLFWQTHWGDWERCRTRSANAPLRDVAVHLLARPTDFRGALARLPVEVRGLYLAAFQSWLWNQMLATLLQQELAATALMQVPLKVGTLPFFRELSATERARLQSLELPLPSARLHLDEGSERQLIAAALQPFGLELRELRVKYPRDSFFAKGQRAALITPAGLTHTTADDELYAGRCQLVLDFELPRGAYATMLVKRLPV